MPVPVGIDPETLDSYRRELSGYCYRMLGSVFEAEDAVQETLIRALRAGERFEGRSSLRSWLYRIATNICLDMLRGRNRRALPVDLGPSSFPSESLLGAPVPGEAWLTPVPDGRWSDPEEEVLSRDSIRLAFIAALQHLPPRQRAVLILCEVLKTPAAEAAAILSTSTAAVTSALQRARQTLRRTRNDEADPGDDIPVDRELLDRYVDAFQRYDMAALRQVLRDDAIMQMPPFSMWLRGSEDITRFMTEPGPSACAGSVLVPAGTANGEPAFGQYKPDPAGGHSPWALVVVEAAGAKVTSMHFFLDTERLFPVFGLAPRL